MALDSLRRYRWVLLFVVFTVEYFFVYFHRISVSVVDQDIVANVEGSIGVLSNVYYWTYTAMQIPSGPMADRFGFRTVSTMFLLIASGGSLITCAGTELQMIILEKVMIAAGMGMMYIPLMKLVSVWFPKSDFTMLSGVVITVEKMGTIAATGPLEVLGDALGWKKCSWSLVPLHQSSRFSARWSSATTPPRGGCSLESVEETQRGIAAVESSAARIPALKELRIMVSGGCRFQMCALAYFPVYGTIMTFQETWAVTYFNNIYDFVLSTFWMVNAFGVGKILSRLVIKSLPTMGIMMSKGRAIIYGTSVFAAYES